MGAVFRAIPSKALTLDELKMPEAVRQTVPANNGLILVTGKTGSGKSTTLAAMIDDINPRVKGHILTIEDPIEFVHQRKSCLISQREIGVHSPTLRRGAALGLARRSGRHSGRRVARPGDDEHRRDRGRNGHPGHGHAAHQRRGADRRPHGQRVSRRTSSRTCARCCRRRCAAWSRSSCCRRPTSRAASRRSRSWSTRPRSANLIRQGKLDQLENVMQSRRRSSACAPWTPRSSSCSDQRQITGKEAYKKGINKAKFEPVKDVGLERPAALRAAAASARHAPASRYWL